MVPPEIPLPPPECWREAERRQAVFHACTQKPRGETVGQSLRQMSQKPCRGSFKMRSTVQQACAGRQAWWQACLEGITPSSQRAETFLKQTTVCLHFYALFFQEADAKTQNQHAVQVGWKVDRQSQACKKGTEEGMVVACTGRCLPAFSHVCKRNR